MVLKKSEAEDTLARNVAQQFHQLEAYLDEQLALNVRSFFYSELNRVIREEVRSETIDKIITDYHEKGGWTVKPIGDYREGSITFS